MSVTSSASKFEAQLATAALVLGAIGIAFAPILVRLSEVGPSATAFYRLLFALPVFWLWSGFEKRKTPHEPLSWRSADASLLALAGLFFAADLAVWHWSIHLTSVANATLLANATPIFVTIAACLLFHERVGPGFILGMCVAIVGTAILMGLSVSFAKSHFWGDGLALLAAIFYGGYQLSLKHLRKRFSTAAIMSFSGSVTCATLWIIVVLSSESMQPQTAEGWGTLMALAWVAQVIGQSLIAYAYAHLPASFASVGLLVQPAVAALLAWQLLGESLHPQQIFGAALVLIGIVLARRSSQT